MNWLKLASAAAGAALICSAPSYAATTLTFDDLAQAGTGFRDLTPTNVFEYGGFTFRSNGGTQAFRSFRTSDTRNADPDGAAIYHNWSNTSMTLSKTDGSLFDLISLDFADLSNVGARLDNSLLLEFADGSSESFRLSTDALPGLQTLAVNRKNIKSARLDAGHSQWLQLDNITFGSATAAVPEPTTWAMMILGFAGIGGTLRTRRRATARCLA